jgi:hypothetical protein
MSSATLRPLVLSSNDVPVHSATQNADSKEFEQWPMDEPE